MLIWKKIHEWLLLDKKLILLYVIDSQGSSPGRVGFKMIVDEQGEMFGSIGGGIMEHKLVERCKDELLNIGMRPYFQRQIHRADIPQDRSGMICSGEQTIAFYPLNNTHILLVSEILNGNSNGGGGVVLANESGLSFEPFAELPAQFSSDIINKEKWTFKEDLGHKPDLHIIGGGHVGLALSRLAPQLGFVVSVYDDRATLNTFNRIEDAQCIPILDYAKIGEQLEAGPKSYVVLMSFGYRTDKVIIKQLLKRQFKYLGMMGSAEKVKVLFDELLAEGFNNAQLDKVYSPIGLQIASRTPEEIAISILAEMIKVKNAL